MLTRYLTTRLILVGVLASSTLVAGCGTKKNAINRGGLSNTVTYTPPNASFAQALGISVGPISAEQAKSIAQTAAGGTALSVEQEDEDGVQVFGVAVDAADGRKDVKVRIADGAVTKIESDDGNEAGDEGGGEGGE